MRLRPGRGRDLACGVNEADRRGDASSRTNAEHSTLFAGRAGAGRGSERPTPASPAKAYTHRAGRGGRSGSVGSRVHVTAGRCNCHTSPAGRLFRGDARLELWRKSTARTAAYPHRTTSPSNYYFDVSGMNSGKLDGTGGKPQCVRRSDAISTSTSSTSKVGPWTCPHLNVCSGRQCTRALR
jgi:hypothetical protein